MLISSPLLEKGNASAITSQALCDCREKQLAAKGANEAQPSAETSIAPCCSRQNPSA